MTAYLSGSATPLAERYDVAMLDLDGVVYVGNAAVPAAPDALAAARRAGMRLAFVTNNAARPAVAVAELLTSLGVPAEPDEVITSAQTAAHYLGPSAARRCSRSGRRRRRADRGPDRARTAPGGQCR